MERITDVKVAETVLYYMTRIAMHARRNPLFDKEILDACADLCEVFVDEVFDFFESKRWDIKDALNMLRYYFLDMRIMKSGDIDAQEEADFESAKLFVDALKDEASGFHLELDKAILDLHKAINQP